MTRGIVFAACLSACFAFLAPGGRGGDFRDVDVKEMESYAAANLPRVEWDTEAVRLLERNVATMPDFVAAEALWLAATAPRSLDTTTVFANGIKSKSPAIRSAAASVMAGLQSGTTQRMLINAILLETEPEIVRSAVSAMARLPRNQAVISLMDIMFASGAQGLVVEEASAALRRLTEADVSDSTSAWRDWWLDNEDNYRTRLNGD